jgi:hypothetical protein
LAVALFGKEASVIHLWNHLAALMDASGCDNPEGETKVSSPKARLTSEAWIGWYEEEA